MKRNFRTAILRVIITVGFLRAFGCSPAFSSSDDFNYSWQGVADRVWAGPDFWANRLQDWQVLNGRLECVVDSPKKPMRTVHLLTRRLGSGNGEFYMAVKTGPVEKSGKLSGQAAAGFLIGAAGELDYRAAALVHHTPGPAGGLFAGIDGDGHLFISDFNVPCQPKDTKATGCKGKELVRSEQGISIIEGIELYLSANPEADEYAISLECRSAADGNVLDRISLSMIDAGRLVGNVALVSHPGDGEHTAKFWFQDFTASGEKFQAFEERLCGPVLSAQHTLSSGVLKMTAQMMPIGDKDTDWAELEIMQNGQWNRVARTQIIKQGYTATFRVDNWDSAKDVPYRILYRMGQAGGSAKEYTLTGTIRREPLDKTVFVVAAFTGNHNVTRPGADKGQEFKWSPQGVWFPHSDIVASIKKHGPDLLFFSGDQVYENASPTAADYSSTRNMELDYLYKWYLWCWAYADLCRDIPAVVIPDDHDVYQGNLWGAGGRPAKHQADGGYVHPPEFVNMVQRTQTSHLPDPYDPAPIEQRIGVYYCAVNYGGISFAVIEDRKFKSSAKTFIPGSITTGETEFDKPGFDPVKDGDAPCAALIGERQLAFLNNWSENWCDNICFKTVLSQTLFTHLQTSPKGSGDTPSPLLKKGEYPENDVLRTNTDSDGWPQAERNKALRQMQRCFAVHIAGDTHLGSTVQYGVDDWDDAAFALCVPSVANFWPRRWCPQSPGANHKSGAARYTGQYKDSFDNYMTVYATSNPEASGRQPYDLYDRAPGYGIAKFDKASRKITFECWPRWIDPCRPDAQPYPGWPVVFDQLDNYGKKAAAYLPTLKVNGMTEPVVQIIEQDGNNVVYTLRIKGSSFKPKVFKKGVYTIRVGEHDKIRIFKNIQSLNSEDDASIEVNFEEMTYKVKRALSPVKLNSNWDEGQWGSAEAVELKNYMGDRPKHFPMTQAKLLYDDKNIYVFFKVDDQYIKAVAKKFQDPVWRDSCVEFFFTPSEDISEGYFNLETNCGGTILFCHQTAKGLNVNKVSEKDCRKIRISASLPKLVEPEIENPTVWTLQYSLPFAVLEKYAGLSKPNKGVKWRANFYKCADQTSHPHWLTWSKVEKPQPDFHRPEFFGTIEFE